MKAENMRSGPDRAIQPRIVRTYFFFFWALGFLNSV
jgi:hypothetical protein